MCLRVTYPPLAPEVADPAGSLASLPSAVAFEVPDRRAVTVEHPPPQPIPLGDPRVPVVRTLDRADDDVADAVAAQQRPRAARGRRDVHGPHVLGARARVVLPLELVAGPADHGRAPGEGRHA